MGSLTGVVASKSVTEASKGTLRPIGNRPKSVMAQGCLTERPTSRSGRKLEHSDPVVPYGRGLLSAVNRADFIDFLESKMKAEVTNSFGEIGRASCRERV